MTATVKGSKSAGPHVSPNADEANVVTINFTEDGFTAFGNIWYRGQTVSVERGTPDWDMTVNPATGESWMELDEDTQIDRYGKRMFRPGKWTGKGYDLSEEHLTDEDKALLAKVGNTDPVTPTGTPVARGGRGSRRKATQPPLA